MSTASASGHGWSFFRAGGFDQVKLETGADLLHLDQLDPKLWAALACPTRGLEFDPKTLDLIDTDQDGRIRVPEILAAARWAGTMLKDPSALLRGTDGLPLSAINDATDDGKTMVSAARQVLANMGLKDGGAITVAQASEAVKILSNTLWNGDGIIPADNTDDAALQALINDILACVGGETDRRGLPGVSQGKLNEFYTQLQAFSDWYAQGEKEGALVLPLGDATAPAGDALLVVRDKIDDYFARVRLAEFDERALAAVNRGEGDYQPLAPKLLALDGRDTADFPLARVAPHQALPLHNGLNPAWQAALGDFVAKVVTPALGAQSELTATQWAELKAKLAPFNAWRTSKAGAAVEKLGIAKVRELLAGAGKAQVEALIAQDLAVAAQFNAVANIERLARYVRDLYLLCLNFVSFRDLYDGGEGAIFQCGTLYLDQRSCSLCLWVDDAARHATMAGLAGAYLAYCDCTRKASNEKRGIVAVITQGDDDNLMVGRNGVFYDRQGRDWDATITKIIANPISLRQAFWLPYKKFVRLIEEQVAKRAAAADAQSTAKLTDAATSVTTADQARPPAAAAPAAKKVDVGTVAALGVAFGAIGTFAAALVGYVTGIVKMGPLAIVGALVGVMLVISGPSLILAYIKLRKRNLGPILDANGWAINSRAKINVPLGHSLTLMAKLPPGAKRDLTDQFAEKKTGRKWFIVIVVLAALGWGTWYLGLIEKVVPNLLPKSGYVLRKEAAAQPAPAPAPAPPGAATQPAAPPAPPAPAA